MAHVLVSPLNWGLGHATRDIPVIRTLLAHGHEVTIAACGSALSVLRQEFPDARSIEYPDYPVPYTPGTCSSRSSVRRCPLCSGPWHGSMQPLRRFSQKTGTDLVISDNRLGVFSSTVPSIFISHQLHYHLPLLFWPADSLPSRSTSTSMSGTDRIIVPDNPPGPTLPCREALPAPDGCCTRPGLLLGNSLFHPADRVHAGPRVPDRDLRARAAADVP